MTHCLYELVGPMSQENRKSQGIKEGKDSCWTKPDCRKSFWMDTGTSTSIPCTERSLSYSTSSGLYCNGKLVLETNFSSQGLGAMLSQQDETGKFHVIAYVSWSLCPSERSMCNYSSAKLELLVLKWAVTEMFCDYIPDSMFHVCMDNNPLDYVKESKLSALQIHWLSELT